MTMIPQISCDYESASKTDSSCKLSIGKTSVLVGVMGPIEARSAMTHLGLQIETSIRSPSGVPGSLEKSIESFVNDILRYCIPLDRFHSTQLNISIEILSDDGYLISTILNATMLACFQLGLPLSDFPVAASVACIEDEVIPFPSKRDEALATALLTCCFSSKSQKLIGMNQTHGKSALSVMKDMISSCEDSCRAYQQRAEIPNITS